MPRTTIIHFIALVTACASAEDAAVAPGSTTTGSTEDPAPTSAPTTAAPDPDPTTGTTAIDATSTGTDDPGTTTAATTKQPAPGCGDGVVDPDTEACDDGYGVNSDSAACTLHCKHNVCGDGLQHEGVEACDEGPNNNDATYGGCGTDCKPAQFCGDAEVQGPEECDYGTDNGSGKAELGGAACDATCRFDAKLCFLSSQVYKAYNLGSAAKADDLCRSLAFVAGYDNADNFMAWVSDNVASPAQRFTPTTRPYVLPNGVRVANHTAHLLDAGPITGITRTDKDEMLPYARVWTATTANGILYDPDLDCENWTSVDPVHQARIGLSGVDEDDPGEFNAWKYNDHWTSAATFHCGHEYHLYCFEQ